MKKLIHIASDEKFINSAYWQFNTVFPKQNIFYLLVDHSDKELKHVKINEDFKLIENKLSSIKGVAETFIGEEIIFFHGLNFHSSYLLKFLSEECKIIWILWGVEFHNNPLLRNSDQILGSSFFSFKIKRFLKDLFRQVYYKIRYGTDSPNKHILKGIKRANYCGILYKEEFDLIKRTVDTKIKHFKFTYYPIELMVKDDMKITGDNILIGNSATETNNHIESFKILSNLNIGNRRIITPLNYGDLNYRKEIIKMGNKLFASSFKPLVNFLPLHQYNNHIQQCGIVIMNHYRQQAVGNILVMLWMGAKVYLDERNTLFHYLKRIGIIFCSIQKDLGSHNPYVFKLLNSEEQNLNRQILKKEIGQEVILKNILDQIEKIKN